MLSQHAADQTTGLEISDTNRIAAALFAVLFGSFLLYTTAFAEVTHEAAHDTRHAITVPCH